MNHARQERKVEASWGRRGRRAFNKNRTQIRKVSHPDQNQAAVDVQGEGSVVPRTPSEQPCYKPSGILEKDATTKGLKRNAFYREPIGASVPENDLHARLYAFDNLDGDDMKETIVLERKSFFVFGKDPNSDIVLNDVTAAEKHAVLQFMRKSPELPLKLYLLDFGSLHGVRVNGKKLDSQKYIELLNKDVIKIGNAPLEYLVIMSDVEASTGSMDY